jgi:hypothetical protein
VFSTTTPLKLPPTTLRFAGVPSPMVSPPVPWLQIPSKLPGAASPAGATPRKQPPTRLPPAAARLTAIWKPCSATPWRSTEPPPTTIPSSPVPWSSMRITALLAAGSVFGLEPDCV